MLILRWLGVESDGIFTFGEDSGLDQFAGFAGVVEADEAEGQQDGFFPTWIVQVLADQFGAGLAAVDKVAGGVIFFKGEVHKPIAFGCSLNKEAGVFVYLQQKFADLLTNFGIGAICVPG